MRRKEWKNQAERQKDGRGGRKDLDKILFTDHVIKLSRRVREYKRVRPLAES